MQDRTTNHSKLPKGNPFIVPEGYFETLGSRIEARIDAGRLTGKQKFIRLIKPVAGLAASFLLAFLLIYYPGRSVLSSWESRNSEPAVDELIRNMAAYGLNDNTLYQALVASDDPEVFETNEIIGILSAELNDYDVYTELLAVN